MIGTDTLDRVIGADVIDADGNKIGTASEVFLDDQSGTPEWVSVRTGLFGRKESLLPLRDATFSGDHLEVPFDKDRVTGAPQVDADGDLSPAEEDQLYTYYGLASASGRRSGTTDDVEHHTGHDTSGPTTDDAMTRSEERLNVSTRREQVGQARLRKYVVTEQQSVTVPVSREEVRVEREPITDANLDAAMDGPAISEEEHELTLHAERPVVRTQAVPVERVRLGKQTVTEQESVSGEVRKEQIEFDGPEGRRDRS